MFRGAMTMRRFMTFLSMLFLAGCVFQSPRDLVTPAAATDSMYRGLQLEAFGAYHARFTMSFEGESEWWYQVNLASDGESKEYSLSLEGLPPSADPGDVRVIETNGVYTLRGEATEGSCWRFPASEHFQSEPLTPDDIIKPGWISPELTDKGLEKNLGRSTNLYTFDDRLGSEFSRAEISIWIDRVTGGVLRYSFQLKGTDPLFNFGAGTLSGDFTVLDLEADPIEPIEGCESELPLPEDASELSLLSDFVGYRTGLSPEDLTNFLVPSLRQLGWQQAGDTDAIPGTATLTFVQDAQTLEVFIEADSEWTQVRIFQAPLSSP
jgi:hypothetical protein